MWCLLMRKFALGKMSAAEVQQMAAAAVKSGANSPDMIGLQSLGGMGQVKGHFSTDYYKLAQIRKEYP